MVHLAYIYLGVISRAAEVSNIKSHEEIDLPSYIFLREKSLPTGDTRELTAYDEHGKSMWDFPISRDIFMFSEAFQKTGDKIRHKYMEGLFYDKKGRITKVHFHEDCGFDDLDDLDHILSLKNSEVESYSDCEGGLPCVVVFKEKLIYKFDIRTGALVEYLVKGKPSKPPQQLLASNPDQLPDEYLLIGTQSVVTKHIWDDETKNTIAIIEEMADFEFHSDYKSKQKIHIEVANHVKRDGDVIVTFRGYSDIGRKIGVWNRIEHIGNEVTLGWKILPQSLFTSMSSTRSYYTARFHCDALERVENGIFTNEISVYDGKSETYFPFIKAINHKNIITMSQDQEQIPQLGHLDLNVPSSPSILPVEDTEVLDEWSLAIILSVLTLFGIASICYIGNRRHRDLWRYMKYPVIYELIKDFITHMKSFKDVRRRRRSSSDHEVIKIKEELSHVPNLYKEMLLQKEQEIERLRNNSQSIAGSESKYQKEFQTKSVLGKGGFGVVFEAYNKNDKSNYAIKRIELPRSSSDGSSERIEREFKALMALRNKDLNTRHFIDYYQCWQELNVPKEWVDAHDKEFISSIQNYDSLSVLEKSESRVEDAISEQLSKSSKFSKCSVPSGLRFEPSLADDVAWDGDSNDSWGDDSFSSSNSDTQENSKKLQKNPSDSGLVMSAFSPSSSIRYRKTMEIQRTSSIQSNGSSIIFSNGDGPDEHSSCSSEESVERPHIKYSNTVDFLYIQLQLCRRETLKAELRRRDKIDPLRSITIFEQICLGVQVLHDNEMIHRDLKPANIMFSLDKGAVKIGDLGLVVMKDQSDTVDTNGLKHVNSILEGSIHTGGIGTRLYMAPELREGLSYSYPIDIYALGVILLELFSLFSTQSERVIVIIDACRQPLPSSLPTNYPDIAKLLSNMLDENPQKRPTIAKILKRCTHILLKFGHD